MFHSMKSFLVVIVFVISSTFLYSTIINIPADYATIQAGINASANADTVLVQPGTYVENIDYGGKLITLASLFLTTQDPAYVDSTYIVGDGNGSVVTFQSNEDSTAVLIGFTITNGNSFNGGGILCLGASPYIKNVTISYNNSTKGGGIYCGSSNMYLQNVTISNNFVEDYFEFLGEGGGIYCSFSDLNVSNLTVAANQASNRGGGIYYDNSNSNLEKATIVDNSAAYNGDAIYCYDNSNLSLVNSILWYNSIEIDAGSSVTATYSDIQFGWTGTGNIDADPLFVDMNNGNFNLQPTSPCIDSGDPTSPLDPNGSRVDMGAYYFHYLNPPKVDFVADITSGMVPLAVSFTDLSTQGSGVMDEWYWGFGDGNNSTLQNPTNEYLAPGVYTVSLTVTDVNDSTDTETKVDYITVFSTDPPAAPSDVQIETIGDDATLSWAVVDTTLTGYPASIDLYLVYYSEIPDQDSLFFFHGFTSETTYTHYGVVKFSDHMFYQVSSYVEDLKLLYSFIAEHPKFIRRELEAFIEERKKR